MIKGRFVKGQSGNPGGAKKLPEDLRALINATSEQAKRHLCEVFNTKYETILELSNRRDIPSGLAMMASCMANAIQTGDNRIMATFLDRIIGKPKEMIELTGKDGEALNTSLDIHLEDLAKMIVGKK